MRARDVMHTQPITVYSDTPVGEIAALLLDRRISGVPVCAADGHLIGVVSEADLMWRAESDTTHRRGWWASLLGGRDMAAADFIRSYGTRAADVMTAPAISVNADEDLEAVIGTMERHRIKRVPVVEEGRLVGIISRSDFLRSIARHPPPPAVQDDAGIADRLTGLLRAQPWASLSLVNVGVENGVVHLSGLVESEVERRAYEAAARSVGARGVRNELAVRNRAIAD